MKMSYSFSFYWHRHPHRRHCTAFCRDRNPAYESCLHCRHRHRRPCRRCHAPQKAVSELAMYQLGPSIDWQAEQGIRVIHHKLSYLHFLVTLMEAENSEQACQGIRIKGIHDAQYNII
jgi:hypothetical protein